MYIHVEPFGGPPSSPGPPAPRASGGSRGGGCFVKWFMCIYAYIYICIYV